MALIAFAAGCAQDVQHLIRDGDLADCARECIAAATAYTEGAATAQDCRDASEGLWDRYAAADDAYAAAASAYAAYAAYAAAAYAAYAAADAADADPKMADRHLVDLAAVVASTLGE